MESNDSEVSANGLRFYYENLFPFEEMEKWLSYKHSSTLKNDSLNDTEFVSKREICLTCKRNDNKQDEFFMRWQSVPSFSTLKKRLITPEDYFVHKFDFGAVYDIPVSQREYHPTLFKAQQKELVFDIDMNDYDDIRTCCKDKRVCQKCWLFLTIAVRLLDTALREDFGFQHILWVYSGRRGIHGWVCDTDARLLPNESRAQLADYLNLCTGSDQQSKRIHLRSRIQHPSVDRAFHIAYGYFGRLIKEQDFFNPNNPHGSIDNLYNYIPETYTPVKGEEMNKQMKQKAFSNKDNPIRKGLESYVTKETNSTQIFEKLCHLTNCATPEEFRNISSYQTAEYISSIPSFIKEVVLAFAYPRLDINVTKDMAHLLKSPFCIHHSTGRVCVPIDIDHIDEFDPQQVPTLSLLWKEYDDPMKQNIHPLERTSLYPFIKVFKSVFLENLEKRCLEEINFLRQKLQEYTAMCATEESF